MYKKISLYLREKNIKNINIIIISLFCILLLFHFSAFAADDLGFDIGGSDKSSQFSTIKDLIHTIAVFAVQYIARLIGACLVIYGLFTAALKDKLAGVMAMVFGGFLLFLPTILQQFIKFGTT